MRRASAVLAALTLAAACGSDDGDANARQRHRGTRTEAPASEAPATEAPSSEAPASEAPATRWGRRRHARQERRRRGRVRHRHARTARRRCLLPGARRRRHHVLRGERIRGAHHGRQHPARGGGDALENLARQNVDVLMVGAGEISDPLNQLIPKYPISSGTATAAPGTRTNRQLSSPTTTLGDQLHRRLRHRPVDAGRRADQGGVHRQLQLRLRAGGIPGLRDGSPRRRPDFEWTYVATGTSTTSPRRPRRSTTSMPRVLGPCTRIWAAPTRRSSGWPTRRAMSSS